MINLAYLKGLACALVLFAPVAFAAADTQPPVTPAEARAIAKDAYIYGYPLVDHYRVQYDYFVNSQGPEFKAPWNHIANIPRVFTPADKAVQTPNSDTPYSWMGLDLRAEPIVLTLPPIEKGRYFSVQFTDAYTFNFDYLGTRTTGNDGGSYLVVGPNWKGPTPAGVKRVVRSETQFVTLVYRTQSFNPGDIDNVKKIQAGYKVQLLSQFLGTTPPAAPPAIDFVKPLSKEDQKTSLEFFSILNFALQSCPTNPAETDLMARFARIGVGAGKTFDPDKLSPEMKAAIGQGISDAWADFNGGVNQLASGQLTSGDLFGTREYLKGNYLDRMLGTIGIFGNSKQEAIYPIYYVDADKQRLNGANRYTLHFAPGQLPPVHAFWSLTMYELPSSLLVENPIDRYLINSPMLPQLKRDSDGGLTLYVQNESPGKDKEANWLPAPQGPFSMYLRLYWPTDAALNGRWTAPKAERQQ
ncbi:putative lipoprotein [Caballeronia choica]|uniref:Lipoprotein n=1 Tax=Caballeronia choica TaxID=326476 RepID=A0A158KHD7_9BURK|nr:DUF1254 domain-containing protein [Caballeronia choica]SAL79831.1 putative lipoprotein [Caballeronia choica]